MLSFCFLCFLLYIFLLLTTNTNFIQLNSLLCSDYIYSANIRSSNIQDNYFLFDAGINFSQEKVSETGINADIIMQVPDSVYTDSVYWNANKMNEYEIAISKNIARAFSLNIGDKLFSKHIVTGKIVEYNIDQILPEVACVRVVKEQNYSNGIIIMSYDAQYADNISHEVIVFTNGSMEDLTNNNNGRVEKILYRDDEILTVNKRIIPYLSLFMLLSILFTIGFVILITKNISHNFRRLLFLGFGEKELNQSYSISIYRFGIPAIFAAYSFSIIILFIIGSSLIKIAVFTIIMITELFTLFFSALYSKRQLWEK